MLPGRQDFLLHSVTRLLWSCFISHMYGSAALCPSAASGLPNRLAFYDVFKQPRPQIRRASLGKTYCLPRYRPASHRRVFTGYTVSPSHDGSTPPQRHIAGSLFVTYLGSTSYFLQTPHFWQCPCPVGVVLPSGNGARFTSRLRPEDRQVRHARRTWIPTGKPVAPTIRIQASLDLNPDSLATSHIS